MADSSFVPACTLSLGLYHLLQKQYRRIALTTTRSFVASPLSLQAPHGSTRVQGYVDSSSKCHIRCSSTPSVLTTTTSIDAVHAPQHSDATFTFEALNPSLSHYLNSLLRTRFNDQQHSHRPQLPAVRALTRQPAWQQLPRLLPHWARKTALPQLPGCLHEPLHLRLHLHLHLPGAPLRQLRLLALPLA